jgi:hypothetical protein
MPPTHNINHSGDIGLRRFGIFNQGHFYFEKKRPENRYGSYCQTLVASKTDQTEKTKGQNDEQYRRRQIFIRIQ